MHALRIIAPSVLLLISIASEIALARVSTRTSNAELQFTCWDRTFAYNSFTVEKTPSHFFISFSGSQLVDKDSYFPLNNAVESLAIEGDWQYRDWLPIMSVFKKEECDFNGEEKSISCASGSIDSTSHNNAMLFISRQIDDLGTTHELVSMFPMNRLELFANQERGSLKNTVRYANGEIETRELRVQVRDEMRLLNCDDEFNGPRATKKLVDHMSRR